jgi:hypothetical protein
VIFCGIDVTSGQWLTAINVTLPGGDRQLRRFPSAGHDPGCD